MINTQPKVIILTINYNQPEMTLECIDSILKLNYGNFELKVVDNSSNYDNYYSMKNRLPNDSRLELLKTSSNLGYGKGVNFGLEKTKHLKADYWLIMNNDTIIDSDALTALVHTAEKYDRSAIVSGKTYHFDDPQRIQYIGGMYSEENKFYNPFRHEIDVGQAEEEMEMEMIDDIFWLLPNKIFQKLGGYCPYYFMYGEQSDYAEQAKKNGFKLIYTPKAKLWHKGEASSGENNNPIANYWRSKSGMIFIFRNRSKKKFVNYFLKTFIKSIMKTMLFFLTKEKFKTNLARLLGIVAFIRWYFVRDIDFGYNPFIKKKK